MDFGRSHAIPGGLTDFALWSVLRGRVSIQYSERICNEVAFALCKL
jgi:hypothetical protein